MYCKARFYDDSGPEMQFEEWRAAKWRRENIQRQNQKSTASITLLQYVHNFSVGCTLRAIFNIHTVVLSYLVQHKMCSINTSICTGSGHLFDVV